MFFTRKELEVIEDQSLAPYGIRSKNSKGRCFPEDEPEYRTAFQRDRDRILHTTAFRRLEYKTQVFINYEGDYYRTRLTHTLEVSQIGRTIARALGANPELTEAICLAHDLGHPPFGHNGETTLAHLMKDHGGFDHNRQSLRIVTKLEQRYLDFPGLNLTWEVREGIVKHESEYDIADARDYDADLRGHLEAQITNWRGQVLDDLSRHRMIRNLIDMEVSDLIHATDQNLRDSGVHSVLELQKLSFNAVSFSEEMHRRNRQLKDFLYSKLYRHHRVVRMAVKAERIISDLFRAYLREPAILPDHVQEWTKERGLERTICDYIAGMTDRFAVEEYQKLFDPVMKP
jgi:dGTPase